MPTTKRSKLIQKRVHGGRLYFDWKTIDPKTREVSKTGRLVETGNYYVKPAVLFRSLWRDGERIHKNRGPAERKSDRRALRAYLQSQGFDIGKDGLIHRIGNIRPAKKDGLWAKLCPRKRVGQYPKRAKSRSKR